MMLNNLSHIPLKDKGTIFAVFVFWFLSMYYLWHIIELVWYNILFIVWICLLFPIVFHSVMKFVEKAMFESTAMMGFKVLKEMMNQSGDGKRGK